MSDFACPRNNRSPLVGLFFFFCEEKSLVCDCTEIRTHVPTSKGFEVINGTTGATGGNRKIRDAFRFFLNPIKKEK